jgi:hypothetical protein
MSDETRPGVFGEGGAERLMRLHGELVPGDCDPCEGDGNAGPSPSAKNMVMLTNHGAALLYLHANPDARVRDVADALHITERATARILADLKASGHLRVTHANRRNRYEVTGMLPLHPGDTAAQTLSDLLMRMSSLSMSTFVGSTAAI